MAGHIKHGEAIRGQKTTLHAVWGSMIQRCTNCNHPHFKYYGGRGITVCDEWRQFVVFRDWALANGYSKNLEIDRENNDGNYTPQNCHFTTRRYNLLNRSKKPDWGITKVHQRWTVQVTRFKIGYHLGSFETIEKARIARDYFIENYDEMKSKYRAYPFKKVKIIN
jgi:hypothetical protein